MDFVCAQCGHRQDADTACEQCDNDIVHDLRESETLRYLREVDGRLDSKRSNKIRAIGAALGVVVLILSYGVFVAFDIQVSQRRAALLTFGLAVGTGLVVTTALEKTWGKKSRFPFLYED